MEKPNIPDNEKDRMESLRKLNILDTPLQENFERIVAKRLLTGYRATDSVGRWGGEEFLVIMNNADTDNLFLLKIFFKRGSVKLST